MSQVRVRTRFWELVGWAVGIFIGVVAFFQSLEYVIGKIRRHWKLIQTLVSRLWDMRVAGAVFFVSGILLSAYTENNTAYGGMPNPTGWYGWVFYGSNLALGGMFILFGMLFMSWPRPRRYYRSVIR